jgi:hypothetical protein
MIIRSDTMSKCKGCDCTIENPAHQYCSDCWNAKNPKGSYQKGDWRKFREKAIAKNHGDLATIHPLCRDCSIDSGLDVFEAKRDTYCRRCNKDIPSSHFLSLYIMCSDCSTESRKGFVRRLNYPAQCGQCGLLLSGKENPPSSKAEKTPQYEWKDYIGQARELLDGDE